MNKVIFYCEILKCKKVILEPNNNVYIKNTINDEKFNLTIEIAQPNTDYTQDFVSNYYNPYYHFLVINPENRFSLFKNEMLKNLPDDKTNQNDLFIHIRGGDIFKNAIVGLDYIQPPYCFYKTVINLNIFDKIYIIADDELNPVLNKLLTKFPNIIYKKNKIDLDISYLAHAYNIIGSISSFFVEIIKINDNLVKLYEYNKYLISEKIFHLHHLLYNFKRKYTIYLMESSNNYKKIMYF